MIYYPVCDHCGSLITAAGIVCKLCGIRYGRGYLEEDEYLHTRDDAAIAGWLFNYDGKQEHAICPECQKRNK